MRIEAGITEEEAKATHENIPLALLGWVAGCAVVWSGLFTVGNFLYGRYTTALILLGVFVIAGGVLIAVIRRLWGKGVEKEIPPEENAGRNALGSVGRSADL